MSAHSTKDYQDKIQNLFSLFNSKKFFDAEDEVKNLIKIYPEDFLLENIYGVILSAQHRYDESLIHLKRVTDLNKDFVEGYYNIGTVYLKLSKYKDAVNYFKTSTKSYSLCRVNHSCVKTLQKLPLKRTLRKIKNYFMNDKKIKKIYENNSFFKLSNKPSEPWTFLEVENKSV
jgi:tetratricopeptide (TPR) repeat protein